MTNSLVDFLDGSFVERNKNESKIINRRLGFVVDHLRLPLFLICNTFCLPKKGRKEKEKKGLSKCSYFFSVSL